jgi:hypothetical protein
MIAHRAAGRDATRKAYVGEERRYGVGPVGRCNAVFVRWRTSHFERPAQPSAIARSSGGQVVGRPSR